MDIATLLVLLAAVGIGVYYAVKHYREGQEGKGDPSKCDCPADEKTDPKADPKADPKDGDGKK